MSSAPVKAGWIVTALSLLLWPLAVVSLILGGIVVARGETSQGVAIMIASVLCVVVSFMIIGTLYT